MKNPQNKAYDFLSRESMFAADIDPQELLRKFSDAMECGLNGEESSLDMLPSYIEVGKTPVPGSRAVIMDAGGTNLRTAVAQCGSDGKFSFDKVEKKRAPGIDSELGKEAYFDSLAARLLPLREESDVLGFCFSYSTEMLPNMDGRLLNWSKEVKAPEVVGQMINAEVNRAVQRLGGQPFERSVLLNDTVATLLAGMTNNPHRQYSDYIGYILGTGVNSSYCEKNRNIGKLPADAGLDGNARQIINTESGTFSDLPLGEADIALDRASNDPGTYIQEKLSSGRYFGPLVAEALKIAGRERLFSSAVNEIFLQIEGMETKEADNYLHNPHDSGNKLVQLMDRGNASDDERETLYHIVDALLERAALTTASTLAALILKSGGGTSPLHPVCITVDGTTYYAYNRFPERVNMLLRGYLSGENQRFFTFNRVEDAPMLGAAIAAALL